MPEQLTLSQPAWTLLDMLQQQLGVTIEVLDAARRPVAPPGVPVHGSGVDDPSLAEEVLKSIRSGELRIDRTTGAPVGIFPLRLSRRVVGCLLVTSRIERGLDLRPLGEANVESAGHLARTALESDLSLNTQLTDARYRTRRVHGILRFLMQLGGAEGERDVMHAVVQAATVWFDLDCRIYHRYPDGSYAPAAGLPGVDLRTAPSIEAGRAGKLTATRRFSAGGDLEDLGLGGRQQEGLVLPVGAGPAAQWLVVLTGAVDHEVELTFGAIARVLEGQLLARDVARLTAWQQRLSQVSNEGRDAPERVVLRMLEALVERTAAASASLVLATEGRERVLAALGLTAPASGSEAGRERHSAEPALATDVPVAPGTVVRLSLTSPADPHDTARQAESWVTAMRAWLHEAASTLSARDDFFEQVLELSPFERRIQEEVERAKRFNLGLGLVVIDPASAEAVDLYSLLEAVRAELRASDLVGRIRDGQVAVLLVHAEAMSADSVIARIRRRLRAIAGEETRVPFGLGRALFSSECASAEALIAHAQRTAAESRN